MEKKNCGHPLECLHIEIDQKNHDKNKNRKEENEMNEVEKEQKAAFKLKII